VLWLVCVSVFLFLRSYVVLCRVQYAGFAYQGAQFFYFSFWCQIPTGCMRDRERERERERETTDLEFKLYKSFGM
jgi:hypothetical protein